MGPRQHPRYTRADFGQEAVGGSTTTTRARKRHATRDTQCEQQVCRSPLHDCGTRVVNTETGGDLTAWYRNKRNIVASHPQHGSGAELRTTAVTEPKHARAPTSSLRRTRECQSSRCLGRPTCTRRRTLSQ